MAAAFICDGCGVPIDQPKHVGQALVRDYCEGCELIAQAFVDSEEKLRADLQKQFADAREALIKETLKDLAKLPDVVSAG